jgi:hypothetical protein
MARQEMSSRQTLRFNSRSGPQKGEPDAQGNNYPRLKGLARFESPIERREAMNKGVVLGD